MLHTHSDASGRRPLGWLQLAGLMAAMSLMGGFSPLRAAPPQATTEASQAEDTAMVRAEVAADSLIAAAVEVGPSAAALSLELGGGRQAEFALRDGGVMINGSRVAGYSAGGPLDSSWRSLLDRASLLGTAQLATLLREWDAPQGEAGDTLESRIRAALEGVPGAAVPAAALSATPDPDSIDRLLARIDHLEERVERTRRPEREQSALEHAFGHFVDGFADLLQVLVMFAVLLGLGWAGVYFANARMERVADTIRQDTLRAGLIGVAAAFLAFPVWLLGIIALAISIVGVPLLLAWLPMFPFAVAVAGIVGYLSVGRAAGEALVERHFTGAGWYQRANAYYYVAAGMGLLLAPFALAAAFSMTGHILEWLAGLMLFVGIVITFITGCIGFGAVVIRTREAIQTRRDRRARGAAFEEASNV